MQPRGSTRGWKEGWVEEACAERCPNETNKRNQNQAKKRSVRGAPFLFGDYVRVSLCVHVCVLFLLFAPLYLQACFYFAFLYNTNMHSASLSLNLYLPTTLSRAAPPVGDTPGVAACLRLPPFPPPPSSPRPSPRTTAPATLLS